MKTTGAFAALLFVIALVSIGSHDAAFASTFAATDYSVTLSSSSSSADSNYVVSFTLDSPHSLDEAHVSFIPSAWSVAGDVAIPNGAVVGSLAITGAESISNGACANTAFLNYTLLDASTDTGTTVADNPRIPDAGWPGFADADANNLDDAVDKYPAFLNTLYPGLTPRSRAYGFIDAGIATINRVVNVLVFDPGTALPGMDPIDASLGYIVVVVAQDPTAPAAVSPVSDECSAFVYTRQDRGLTANNNDTPANEAGFVYRTNPAVDGTYTFMEYLRSLRDFDDDGIENRLDACPYDSTSAWNPRISDAVNDPDGDGIPGKDDPAQSGDQLLAGTGCDPTPLTADPDPDTDSFTNRQDNCPLVANPLQEDPDADGIGSACDVVDTVPDGHLHEVCVTANVDIGVAGTSPTLTCPEFAVDMDSDGFIRTVEEHVGTGPQDSCGNDGWPADLDSTGMSTNDLDVFDVTSFLAPVRRLGSSPGDPGFDSPTVGAGKRWDLSPGAGVFTKDINVTDLTQLIILYAPMHEGLRSFNGPPCPWP